jgi:hypothetical protein
MDRFYYMEQIAGATTVSNNDAASERNNLLHLVAEGSPACRAAQWSTAIAPNGCPADGST